MLKAAIFDLDGTLLDSVDLHALAWQEAMAEFGHNVPFEDIRGQIGKAADTLLPVFLSERDRQDHGKELDEWRAARYKGTYLQLVRPFSAVPALLRRAREAGLRIAIASCPKRDDLADYLAIAEISDLVDVTTSAEEIEKSKPAPDVFNVTLRKLGVEPAEADCNRRHSLGYNCRWRGRPIDDWHSLRWPYGRDIAGSRVY
jgi:beta-phosphoglucomutase-like phosphatase (HAD superfamily)